MSINSNYTNVPVSARIGNGCYTYKFVIHGDTTIKWEIMANSVEEAISIITYNYGAVISWQYVDSNTVSLVINKPQNITYLLYL